MRFGGHQTFFVREGWLAKGLALLGEDASAFDGPYVADQLGVGRNMAKSIEHWLLATGLAEKTERRGRGRAEQDRLKVTELGEVVAQHDPWFLDAVTWWFLHINLVRTSAHAATWHWFFNHYASSRFDRGTVVAQLEHHERMNSRRTPTRKTLERDVSCFLGSYAVEVPYRRKDPEEEIDCPFQELRIIRHFRASGYYELNRRRKSIPDHAFLYALQAPELVTEASTGTLDVTLHDLQRMDGGPAQVLALSADALFEHLVELGANGADVPLTMSGLAGDRQLRFDRAPAPELMARHFEVVAGDLVHA
jgi:hypothetical protein